MHGAHDHHGHGHRHHHHHPAPAPSGADPRWAIGIALNLAFVAVEATAGFLAGSTALLADAGHNLSDVLGLALAGGAAWLASRPGHSRRTWGWGKATVLAALVNGATLIFACGAIAWEALGRIGRPGEVDTLLVAVVAGAGVLVNAATAAMFLRGSKEDANLRGAFLHMAADAGVSAGVIVAAGLIALTGAFWIDPLVALAIVGVILWSSWGLLREALDLALDAVPPGVDPDAIRAWLAACEGVEAVHDLHVWPISTTETALTAHLVMPAGGGDAFLKETCAELSRRFRIGHATFQIERESLAGCADLHA